MSGEPKFFCSLAPLGCEVCAEAKVSNKRIQKVVSVFSFHESNKTRNNKHKVMLTANMLFIVNFS